MTGTSQRIWHTASSRRSEPVLFRREIAGGPVRGRLLFSPERILRISLADGTEISPKKFMVSGRHLATESGTVPSLEDEDLFPSTDEAGHQWWSCDGSRHIRYDDTGMYASNQVLVDYETREQWDGPQPEFQNLRFSQRLVVGEQLSVVLLGDSISAGADASSYLKRAPFQPPYGELFVQRIETENLRFRNLSKGGMTAAWGRTQMDEVLSCQPDLVILGFGMNDASEKHSEDTFRDTMNALTRDILDGSTAEVVVLSGMRANPDWNLSECERRVAFHEILKRLAGERIGFCDVFSTWNYVEEKKDFWSLTGNGLNHPNDFGHRLYADCLQAALLPSKEQL